MMNQGGMSHSDFENTKEHNFISVFIKESNLDFQPEGYSDEECEDQDAFADDGSDSDDNDQQTDIQKLTPEIKLTVEGGSDTVDEWYSNRVYEFNEQQSTTAWHFINCTEPDITLQHIPCDFKSTRKRNKSEECNGQEDSNSFSCRKCAVTFTTLKDLKNHGLIHTVVDKPYQCKKCSYASYRKGNLKQHVKTHQQNTGATFICTFCSFKSRVQSLMTKHLKIHTKDEECYVCNICNHESPNQKSFLEHGKHHEKAKSYKCIYCSYSSPHYWGWMMHQKLHKGDKHSCIHCNYSTSSKYDFIVHTKIHTEGALQM